MEFFKLIFEFAKIKGVLATFNVLLFGVVSATIYTGIKSGKLKNLFKRLLGKNKTEQIDLINHQLFIQLRKYISYDIQHFSLQEKLREAIFKDFLLFKFTIIQKSFQNFLLKGDLEKLSRSTYNSKMSEGIEEIIKCYETKAREEGIPEIVIKKFNEWHKDRIESVYSWINIVCEEEIYKTNTERTKVILDFMVHINNLTILDAKKTLVNLNGQLNGLTYKGISYKVNDSGITKVIL